MHTMADMKELLADCLGLHGRVLTACMLKKSAAFKLVFLSNCLNKPLATHTFSAGHIRH